VQGWHAGGCERNLIFVIPKEGTFNTPPAPYSLMDYFKVAALQDVFVVFFRRLTCIVPLGEGFKDEILMRFTLVRKLKNVRSSIETRILIG